MLHEVDCLIVGATILTLNKAREIIRDGAVAIEGGRLVAVGKATEVQGTYRGREHIDANGFLLTPGFVDGHIHITGDPLTRGFPRAVSEEGFADSLEKYVIPLYRNHTPEDEHLSARLAALAMLKSGTTCFMEAGTVSHLDAVVAGLRETGIRGRVGNWIEGRAFDPATDQEALSRQEIDRLEQQIAAYPADGGALIAATPVLVGHVTNSDAVWQAAKRLADAHGLTVSAHMSPHADDPDWYLANIGRRPIVHLAELGALGPNVCLTHVAHIDDAEFKALVESGTNVIHCPHGAVYHAFGVSKVGRFPEMLEAGVNVLFGTDGIATDIQRSAQMMAGVFKDARMDSTVLPATQLLEMATLNGARALGLDHEIGSLEVGKKADLVLHDTNRPEMRPLFDPVGQLMTDTDGRSVHSVWVDGQRVVANGRATLIDEAPLIEQAQRAGEEIIARCGLSIESVWPTR